MRFHVRNHRITKMTAIKREENRLRRMWTPRIMHTSHWFKVKKFVRVNGLHKMDVFHSRIGKPYCISIIWDAQIGRMR